MNLLAVDVGTSFVKAAILDATTAAPLGKIGRAAYDLDHPVPEAAELPLERLWMAVTGAVRQATVSSTAAIEGVGFSCMMPTLVLLDRDHRPLCPALTHLDRRARGEAAAVEKEVGAEFHAANGNLPLPGGISALSFRALIARDASIEKRVAHYLHLNSWLAWKLTGRFAIDRANAAFTGLYDTFATKNWSDRWCGYFGVDRRTLPPIVSGEETVGTLGADVAASWKISAGLPVKIGTADTSSALLAANVQRGEVLHVAGTTQVLAAITDPNPGPKRLVRPLGVGGDFVHVTHNALGGAALDWLRTLSFCEMEKVAFYDAAIDQALAHPTSVVLDPAYLGGDRLEMEAKSAGFRHLTLSTKRIDLLAAVLVAMREGHEKAVSYLGVPTQFSHVHLTGGAADVVLRLLPQYRSTRVTRFDEGSLRGVARLFR